MVLEYFELVVVDLFVLFEKINNVGVVFLGCYMLEVVGDYIVGINYVFFIVWLVKYVSGLFVLDFMKWISFVCCDVESLSWIGGVVVILVEFEGLDVYVCLIIICFNL